MNGNRYRVGRRELLRSLAVSAFALARGGWARTLGLVVPAVATADVPDAGKALRAAIVYYSASGSTAKVAMAMHRGMREVVATDLLPLKKADPKTMAQYDLIAIGGPIWYFREPANLRLFVHQMPQLPGRLCVPFCTHGSEPMGFFYSLNTILKKRELTIIGWKDWYGSVVHVLHMPKPYLTDGHPDPIDLDEAEDFGRRMAERAQRIRAGETNLIPPVPYGPDTDDLWVNQRAPRRGGATPPGQPGAGPMPVASAATAAAIGSFAPGGGEIGVQAGGAAPPGAPPGSPPGGPEGGRGFGPEMMVPPKEKLPEFDMNKCVYPRCDACEDGCPVNAIDFSLAAPGSASSGSDLIVKQACVGCSLCERLCIYDACTHESSHPKTGHEIDMAKCVYPECTLCVDNCPMNAIDFSENPPLFHKDCEGCDMCWSVCPKDAISIPNMDDTHMKLLMTGPDHPFVRALEHFEKAGTFRRLVPISEVGFDNPIYKNPNAPRIVLDKDGIATWCGEPCQSPLDQG